MRRWKKIGIAAALIMIVSVILFARYYLQMWPLRFRAELDAFFGKGNWETVSSEAKESMIYTVRYRSSNRAIGSEERPGKFHTWDIACIDSSGEGEIWSISDHTMRINQDRHWLFSPDRYSAKQALALEFMDVSCAAAGEKLREDILLDILPEQEADCLDVEIFYRNGNPPPDMYDVLLEEPWFTAKETTAANYLSTDLYDFYIHILAHDYRVEKLSADEQEHLMGSLAEIEEALKAAYGEYADYDIYLGEGREAVFQGTKAAQAAGER